MLRPRCDLVSFGVSAIPLAFPQVENDAVMSHGCGASVDCTEVVARQAESVRHDDHRLRSTSKDASKLVSGPVEIFAVPMARKEVRIG